MKWLITRLFPSIGGAKKQAKVEAKPVALPGTMRPANFTYPSSDDGYSACLSSDVIGHLALNIDRIRVAVTDRQFDRLYAPAIEALAEWILNLPRTESDEFAEPTGLLRYSIESAFHCQRMAEQSLFASEEAIEQRQKLEDGWCYASFLAGLFSEIFRLSSMVVCSLKGETWSCFNESLADFLDRTASSSYFLTFKPASQAPDVSPSLALRIIPPALLQHLNDTNPNIVRVMLLALEGRADPLKPRVHELVEKAREGVIAQEQKVQRKQYGRLRQGTHMEPYLVDGLRTAIKGWKINDPTGFAWVDEDALYVSRAGIEQVIQDLVAKDIKAIPAEVETVAELLISMGLASKGKDGSLFWAVYPVSDAISSVKLPDADRILGWGHSTPPFEGLTKKKPKAKPRLPKAAPPSLDMFQEQLPAAPQENAPATVEAGLPDEDRIEIVSMTPAAAKPKRERKPLLAEDENPPAAASSSSGMPEKEELGRVAAEAEEVPNESVPPSDAIEDQSRDEPPADIELNERHGQGSLLIEADDDADSSVRSAVDDFANAQPIVTQLSERAEKLLKQTHDPAISEFLKAVLDDHNNKGIHGTLWIPSGFAIHRDLVPRYGMDEMVLFTKLHTCGWLSKNPQKPNQKFLEVEFPDGKERALVIKPFIADDLGFKKK